ncbi:MAG: tRNA (adenosine(37)-N6)-threonylcarbamoyltransferase complex transferase subunit TsaD [Candidatus Omnitrophota bacterium]
MYVLGIESSCDETSIAIVENGRRILSCETNSSLNKHKKFGGIVPEIASRMQLETIACAADLAVKEAGIKLKDIKLVAFTDEPGLPGSLLVGTSFAKALSFSLKIPIFGVNHLHSHIYASFLDTAEIAKPFVSLIVSGGHTTLFYVEDFNKIKVLGSTQDDACGEAFDKVAKILGLEYPGGPYIEKMAKKGNPKKIKFKCSQTNAPLDFSFSGIKTAVLYLIRDRHIRIYKKADIAASFQESVIDCLVKKSLLACKTKGVKRLVVGGGVAANNRLRDKFNEVFSETGREVYFPEKSLCMDNAAMVAGLGYQLFKKNALKKTVK